MYPTSRSFQAYKRRTTAAVLLPLNLLLFALLAACGSTAPVPDREVPACNALSSDSVITSPHLLVLTLNLAHGRKDAFNQMFQRSETTRQNLVDIASFLDDSGADVVALQEADAPSRWSGKFDHVEYVSRNSVYPCRLHASHAQKYMYDFGTALLSRTPFKESLAHTFAPSPPTTNKGFVMGEVLWNPGGELLQAVSVSVISVHLDFSRKKVREAQIAEMSDRLAGITTPLVIMGDFNADWDDSDSALKSIVSNGRFKAYKPEMPGLGTYKSGRDRLDWILVSNELDFVSYEVPQVNLSDHLPVKATLKLADPSTE